MKIKQSKRVYYENNPLVEVLCQIRFDRVLRLVSGAPELFQQRFSSKYPKLLVEQVASFQVVIGAGQPGALDPTTTSASSIYHFLSEDEKFKVSINSDFITFSCEIYERWETFKASALEVFFGFLEIYAEAVPRRIGLRYKDLIVRESIGLTSVPWNKLLSPFVAGIFAVDDFFEVLPTVSDEVNIQQASQATLQLEECGLFMQSAMLRSNDASPNSAFLIDCDFFRDTPKYDLNKLKTSDNLEALHGNANALFRRCITETLHDALGPKEI
jgi:uncharacterized protein (TIGR04255 family)